MTSSPRRFLPRTSSPRAYRLLEHLARGRVADVYRAVDDDGEVVALKRLRIAELPGLDALFAAEAAVLAALDHPNLVGLRDRTRATEYIALELVDGVDLAQLLRGLCQRGHALGVDTGVAIAAALAGALHHVHGAGMCHRDLSPGNVLIGFDGTVKLADFGAACLDRHGRAYHRLLGGRPGYLAPEQLDGGHVDRRSDVFCLGILAWEMTTGRVLFPGVNAAERAHHTVVGGHVPRPSQLCPDYPPAVERIVLRALARDPMARYPTAAAMLADLRAVAGSMPARALVGTAMRELWRPTGPLRSSPARAAG